MADEFPEERRRRPLGPILAWIASAAWAAYWIRKEAGRPPVEETPESADGWEGPPVWLVLFAAAGLVSFVGFGIQVLRRRIRSRIRPTRRGSEAFAAATAAWLLLELTLHIVADLGLVAGFGPVLYLTLPIAVLGVGLALPALLGVEARRSRVALGLTPGRGVLREAGIGLLAVPAIPLAAALVDSLLETGPTRPDADEELFGDRDSWLLAVAVWTSLAQAPLLEECALRGLVYRFLRDATARLPRAMGLAFAVIGSSFLFALAHPYGWNAVPGLMVFGAAACMLREWRRSIVAPIALHWGANACSLLVQVLG